MKSRVEKREEARPWGSDFIRAQGSGLGFHLLVGILYWLAQSIRLGARAWEGRSGVTQVASYLGYPGPSEGGDITGGSRFIPYLVVLLVTLSDS